jgi:hypothetical protein
MVNAVLHFEHEHRLSPPPRGITEMMDNSHVMFVLVARPLRSCLFAASNNFAEASNSSIGICDTPGRENTSCTSRKAAARRFDVIGVRSRRCALPSSLVGLLLSGPIDTFAGQIIRVMTELNDGKSLA